MAEGAPVTAMTLEHYAGMTERMARVEQTVEATAIEIERIGEGQRFITRIFTESASPHALPSAAAPPAIPGGRPDDVRP